MTGSRYWDIYFNIFISQFSHSRDQKAAYKMYEYKKTIYKTMYPPYTVQADKEPQGYPKLVMFLLAYHKQSPRL